MKKYFATIGALVLIVVVIISIENSQILVEEKSISDVKSAVSQWLFLRDDIKWRTYGYEKDVHNRGKNSWIVTGEALDESGFPYQKLTYNLTVCYQDSLFSDGKWAIGIMSYDYEA